MLDALTDHPHGIPDGGASFAFGQVECGCLPWYIVRYNAGQQHMARPALHRLGVTTFLPLIRQSVRNGRHGSRIYTVPAFPGYLFAQWRDGFHWPKIIGEPGILGQSGSAFVWPVGQHWGHPAPVPADFMAELFERAEAGGVIRDDTVPPPKAPKRRWTALADLAGPERLDLLHQAMGQRTARRRDVEPA